MGRDDRRFQGRPHGKHHGPRHVRPNRPHFRHFRQDGPSRDQQAPPPQMRSPRPDDKKEFEVYQTRGHGHLRIMGKIEYDIRTLLRVAEVAPDKTFLLLACAREIYSDLENNKKPETLQTALDATTDRWVGRGFESEMIERIRNKVTEIFNSLKAEKPVTPPPTTTPPATPPTTVPDEPAQP
jgi:hypothetical protein